MSNFLPPSSAKRALLLAAAPLLVTAASAATVSAPYSQNFESYLVDGTTDFAESAASAFTVVTDDGDQAYLAKLTNTNGNHSASVNVSGSAGLGFTVTTDARLIEFVKGTAANLNFSLAAAGTGATFSSSEYRVAVDYGTSTVTLIRNGTTLITTTSGSLPSFALNTTLSVSLSAVYSSASVATITAIVSDGTNTFTRTYVDNAALATGTNFGYRVAKNSGSDSTIGVAVDNFNVTVVPEPSAAALVALGGVFLARRRSRRE